MALVLPDEGEDRGFLSLTGQLLNEQLKVNRQVGFGFDDRATSRSCGVIWRAGRDSNPRPSGSKPNGAFCQSSRSHAPLAGQAARPQLLLASDTR